MHVHGVCVCECVLGMQQETRKKRIFKKSLFYIYFFLKLALRVAFPKLPQPTDVLMLLNCRCLLKASSISHYMVRNVSMTRQLRSVWNASPVCFKNGTDPNPPCHHHQQEISASPAFLWILVPSALLYLLKRFPLLLSSIYLFFFPASNCFYLSLGKNASARLSKEEFWYIHKADTFTSDWLKLHSCSQLCVFQWQVIRWRLN